MNVTDYILFSATIRALSPSKIKQKLSIYCMYLLIPILEICTGQVCISEKASDFFSMILTKQLDKNRTFPHTL